MIFGFKGLIQPLHFVTVHQTGRSTAVVLDLTCMPRLPRVNIINKTVLTLHTSRSLPCVQLLSFCTPCSHLQLLFAGSSPLPAGAPYVSAHVTARIPEFIEFALFEGKTNWTSISVIIRAKDVCF